MKTIKKGKTLNGKWAREFTCTGNGNGGGGCGAILLVGKDDLFRTERGDYTGDTDYFVTFKCQECGIKTDLQERACPFHARDLPRESQDGDPT